MDEVTSTNETFVSRTTPTLVAAATSVPAPAETTGTRRYRQLPLLSLRTSFGERFGVEFFRGVPPSPGVYFYYDATGRLLYIGQSHDLRARVGSYRHVSAGRHPRRTLRLVGRIARVEWRVCESPEAAVELERVLLLEHRPPFNRAGVWEGAPWWLSVHVQVHDDDQHAVLEVQLARQPGEGVASNDTANAAISSAWTGPLPSAFRYAHASLLRCVMRLQHPALSLAEYPLGLLNVTVPLRVRLPLHGTSAEDADRLATDLRAFASGDAARVLARLESLTPRTSLLEQEYWAKEVDGLQRYAAKKRVIAEVKATGPMGLSQKVLLSHHPCLPLAGAPRPGALS